MATEDIFSEIEQKSRPHSGDQHGGDFPQWMRRCFMTGKQCIFCPKDTVFENISGGERRDTAFVIMPFRPHLDTFFEWSLIPYLESFGIRKERIGRADQFSNTGYVMCEKICLRIQQAGLVVVDLSVVNANVYYELGIAVGLNKPILAVSDSGAWDGKSRALCEATGINAGLVLEYPNVGHIDADRNPLIERVFKVPLKPRNAKVGVTAVLVREDQSKVDLESRDLPDISVTFQRAIEAAVSVSVRMLKQKLGSEDLKSVFSSLTEDEQTYLSRCSHEYLTIDTERPQSFQRISALVDASMISIVDLAGEHPLAYFWLGYCHGRNINVIPIYRGEQEPQHVLAFDIRALWYMSHEKKDTKQLAEKFAAVLEPILIRDVNTQQRRTFWDLITRKGRVHIYNGAVHHREMGREVVGDWDLRTASELINYLSSTDESVVPVLQSPIYSPETIRPVAKVHTSDSGTAGLNA